MAHDCSGYLALLLVATASAACSLQDTDHLKSDSGPTGGTNGAAGSGDGVANGDQCSTDRDCEKLGDDVAGKVCFDSSCVECATNGDCVDLGDEAGGKLCLSSVCVECVTDGDCVDLGNEAAGKVCVESSCVECATDRDCVNLGDEAGGKLCVDSVCVGCATDQDCEALGSEAAGGVCFQSACVECATHEDCVSLGDEVAGDVCSESVCVECATDQDCVDLGDAAAGEMCVESVCIQCSTDEDCVALGDAAAGDVCVDSVCVQCTTDQDCVDLGDEAAGDVCVESTCVECETNRDCASLGDEAAGGVCADSACVECVNNEDCASLGDEAAGGVCADSVCVECATDEDCAALGAGFEGGACADGVCKLNSRWACAENPPIQDAQTPLEASILLFNVSSLQPEAGVHVSLCGTLDLVCRTPVGEADTDAAGQAVLALPDGYTGYMALESDAIVPQLFFPVLPVLEGETLGMAFVNPTGALEDLGDMLGVTTNTERGLGVVQVYDCNQEAAVGISVEFEGSLVGTKAYYALGGIPTADATVTDTTGVAGLFNAPVGTLTFTVKIGSRTLGRSQMMIRQGYMSFAPLQLGRF